MKKNSMVCDQEAALKVLSCYIYYYFGTPMVTLNSLPSSEYSSHFSSCPQSQITVPSVFVSGQSDDHKAELADVRAAVIFSSCFFQLVIPSQKKKNQSKKRKMVLFKMMTRHVRQDRCER